MTRFSGSKNRHTEEITLIKKWLMENEFEYQNGAQGQKGLTRTYSVNDGFYTTWVTINLENNHLSVYKEYDCGGEVDSLETDFPDQWLISLNIFIEEMGERLEPYIGY